MNDTNLNLVLGPGTGLGIGLALGFNSIQGEMCDGWNVHGENALHATPYTWAVFEHQCRRPG